mgnify:CR=1 FL=1
MKIIPFWKLQTNKQIGLNLGFTLTRFDYLIERKIWQVEIDLIIIRIRFRI